MVKAKFGCRSRLRRSYGWTIPPVPFDRMSAKMRFVRFFLLMLWPIVWRKSHEGVAGLVDERDRVSTCSLRAGPRCGCAVRGNTLATGESESTRK
jgi:hypothetical protein